MWCGCRASCSNKDPHPNGRDILRTRQADSPHAASGIPYPVAHIPSNYRLLSVLSCRAGEVTLRPKLSAPSLLLYRRAAFENLARRQTLYQHHDPRHVVTRHRLHPKVDMVLVCSDLHKLQRIALGNPQTYFREYLTHSLVKYCSSLLRRKDQVVRQNRNIMTLVYVLAHPARRRRKRRGIEPRGALKINGSHILLRHE